MVAIHFRKWSLAHEIATAESTNRAAVTAGKNSTILRSDAIQFLADKTVSQDCTCLILIRNRTLNPNLLRSVLVQHSWSAGSKIKSVCLRVGKLSGGVHYRLGV